MKYDEKTISKRQGKYAQRFIDSVLAGSQLEHPPKYVIMGLNSDEEIANLEFQKLEKNEREIKKIDKEIKFIQSYVNEFVKVIFEFERNPRILVCIKEKFETSKTLNTPRYIYSGVLDFPITNPFLFGRVANSPKHGGGNYYFASLENFSKEIIHNIEELEKKVPDLFPFEVIEANIFLEYLGSLKFIREFMDQLKKVSKLKNSSSNLVNTLNQQNDLIKNLKKITHLGTAEWMNYAAKVVKFVSEVDISTIFIPYKNVTYFHIDQFVKTPKKQYGAIFFLLNFLMDYKI
jgi:hypothetical protein